MWRTVNSDFGSDLQPNGFGDLATTQMNRIKSQTRANANVTGQDTLDVTTALVGKLMATSDIKSESKRRWGTLGIYLLIKNSEQYKNRCSTDQALTYENEF